MIRSVALVCALGLAGSIEAADWNLYTINKDRADYRLESIDAGTFRLSATRKEHPGKTMALAIADVNRNTWTHDKIVLSVRSLDGRAVHTSVTVSWADGDKTSMKGSSEYVVSGRNWKDLVLSLDNDFGLGDRGIQIRQVKIALNPTSFSAGATGGIEVAGFRVCGPNEVSKSAAYLAGDTFVAVPSKTPEAPAVQPDALKVYFTFDNEDLSPSRSRRKKGLWDAQQYGGFREILLEKTDGNAVVTTNLDAADVIVHTSCRKDPELARKIATRVTTQGVPLYVTSEVLDPEIENLLPCEVGHGPLQDLPPRHRVIPADLRNPLVRAGGISDAKFAVFRSVKAKRNAHTLYRFDEGPDAVVEGTVGCGRVIYSALGLGTSFVPGKEARDAFFLRVLGYLTGRTFPERDRVRAKPSFFGGWYEGNDGFGHFGWEVGNGFLIEDTSARLEVSLGSCQYCFAAPRPDGKPRKTTFAADRINPLAVGGVLTTDGVRTMRYDGSLAYPGLRWDVFLPSVELHLKNTLSYAAYLTKDGVRTVAVCEGEKIDPRAFAAPWLLMWNATASDSPLMLVFGSVPEKLEVMSVGRGVDGLRIASGEGRAVGVIVPTWIWGSRKTDTKAWQDKLPAEALARVNEWYPRAFKYPVGLRERFRLNEEAGMVEIRDDFDYLETADAFDTPTRPYAAIPPVAAAIGAKGSDWFRAEDAARRTSLVTRFGPLLVADDSSRVEWALRIPRQNLSTLPHASGFEKYDALFNSQFADASAFTCGGGVKVDYYPDRSGTAIDPNNDPDGAIYHPASCTFNMHQALLGMCRNTPNPYGYTPENRRIIRRRMTWRLLEPLEDICFKMASRYRREPFSGRRYTIYMNSPRNISTVYEPETFGSKIIYGDSNETVRMIVMCLQKLADQMGQYDIVKANWDTISREVVSYMYAIDCWTYLCSGCLEWGGPGTVDMLNSEVGCMMEYARLAQIAGDEAEYAQAIYRAARRMCPTLARFVMQDYYGDNGLANRAKTGIGFGFNENGAEFRPLGRKRVCDCDLFDMSEGIPNTLISLYQDWGVEKLQREYIPYVLAATEKETLRYTVLSTIGIVGGCDDVRLREKLDEVVGYKDLNDWLRTDWPGMDTCSYVEYIYHRLTGSPVITDCRGIHLHDAQYDCQTRQLTLDFTPTEPDAVLEVAGERLTGLKPGERETRRIGIAPKRDFAHDIRLMVNEDNDHYFQQSSNLMTRAALENYVDGITAGHRVTDVAFCLCGQPANYDSKVWENVWQRIADPEYYKKYYVEGRQENWAYNCRLLHEAGIDPYRVWIDRCRANGARPWLSMRMNDVHFTNHAKLQHRRTVAFWRNHPELRRNPNWDPLGTPRPEWKQIAFDYSKKAVFDYNLAMAKEIIERYGPSGLELDWMRYVCHLTPGKEREQACVLTDFMRAVRRLADAEGKKRGHYIALGVRIPSRYNHAIALGYDPETWAKEGLCDLFVVCNKDAADFECDVADWKRRLAPAAVIPGMDRFDCAHEERILASLDGYRGWADAMHHNGAEGLYLFNAIYTPESVKGAIWADGLGADVTNHPRRYIASYPDSAPDDIPEEALCQLPRPLAAPISLTINVGSATIVGAPRLVLSFDGKKADLAEIRVRINGTRLEGEPTQLTGYGKTFGDPNFVKKVYAWTIPAEAVQPGVNTVAINGSTDDEATIHWAEIDL